MCAALQDEKPDAAQIRHMLLFGYHPDTMRLLVSAALAQFDVCCPALCGYWPEAALPSATALESSNAPTAAGAPLSHASLASAMGLHALVQHPAAPATRPLSVASFEAFAAGQPLPPWHARSRARHAFVTNLLLQLLASQGAFAGEPALTRALFAVQVAPLLDTSEDACTAESADAAADRARASAKRWLQEPLFANSLPAWSAFAANEAHAGRYKQAGKACPCSLPHLLHAATHGCSTVLKLVHSTQSPALPAQQPDIHSAHAATARAHLQITCR